MKNLLIIIFSFFICSCNNNETPIFDEAHKTIYINGISASEGKTRIIESLESLGFERVSIDTIKRDLIGGFNYVADFYQLNNSTKEICDKLTYNLFKDCDFGNYSSILVSLDYLMDGSISSFNVTCGETIIDFPEDVAMKYNQKFTKMFEFSKIGNSRHGYKTYYNSNGLSLYYTNGNHLDFTLIPDN